MFITKRHLKHIISESVKTHKIENDIQLSNGKSDKFGSKRHIKDLKLRIADMTRYRDRQRRGSEARATFQNAVKSIRRELKAAQRVYDRKHPPEEPLVQE